jgi:hypothetical protein
VKHSYELDLEVYQVLVLTLINSKGVDRVCVLPVCKSLSNTWLSTSFEYGGWDNPVDTNMDVADRSYKPDTKTFLSKKGFFAPFKEFLRAPANAGWHHVLDEHWNRASQ